VRDGEGATKFVTVQVERGRNADECRRVAYAVAHSPLVKTAFFASDPTLGRILAAIGNSGVPGLDTASIDLHIDEVRVVHRGGTGSGVPRGAGGGGDEEARVQSARGAQSRQGAGDGLDL